MPKQSAGILLYRRRGQGWEILLAHPGGPFWANKDLHVWSIPKGEFTPEENGLEAARREFLEETGFPAPGPFIPLTPLKQPSGKVIYAWAAEGSCDPSGIKSNTCWVEWPPRSGRQIEIPEIDRVGWFNPDSAREKIAPGQAGFMDELLAALCAKG
ncbi:MAG: NUDIX domain-containing protein [Candidatus Omnitrophota bacterium]|jgi:predicted NUDIX family NTP pyrophosphohydrolase